MFPRYYLTFLQISFSYFLFLENKQVQQKGKGEQAVITKNKPRNDIKLVSTREYKPEVLTKPSSHTSVQLFTT